MTWHKNEEEVDKMIEEMIKRTKGKYLTQGVSFNKTCPRQMELLKLSLMSSASFSGLIKELLALRFEEKTFTIFGKQGSGYEGGFQNPSKNKNTGNFL